MCTVASSCLFFCYRESLFSCFRTTQSPTALSQFFFFFFLNRQSNKLCAILTMQKGQPNTCRHPGLPHGSLSSKHGSIVSVLLSKHTSNSAPGQQIRIYLSASLYWWLLDIQVLIIRIMDTVSVSISFIQAVLRFSLLAMQSVYAIKFDNVLTEHFCFYPKEAESSGIPNFM